MFSSILLGIFVQAGTIHGTVYADETLEPISYASVQVVELDRAVAANDRGYFVIPEVEPGRWTVRVSAIGYAPREVQLRVPVEGAIRVDFELAVRPVPVADIAVEVEGGNMPVTAAGPPAVRVEGGSLALVPGLAEADVFRALQMLPSVAAASDFSSALYVRGGLPSQNLILLDGLPLFNPYHLGGLFAAIDPGAVQSVSIQPGAFPAHLGDRLSSVVQIRTRDGGRDRVRANGAIGLFSSRVGLDGPLPGGNGSFLLSLRRTYLDLFTDVAKALGLISFTVPYVFTDGYMKLTHDVGEAGDLTASLYLDGEGVDMPEDMRRETGDSITFDWGSRAVSVAYRQPLSATILSRFGVAWSSFYGSFTAIDGGCSTCLPLDSAREPDPGLLIDTHMRDLRLSADFTWYLRRHELRSGVHLDRYEIRHEFPVVDVEEDFIPEFRLSNQVQTTAAYIEDVWKPNDAFRLRAGLRLLAADVRGLEWMPRFGARLAITDRLAVSMGGGRYGQVLYSLKNPESLASGVIAYDLLAAVPEGIGFTTAQDIALGIQWANATTNVRLDAYMKWMDDLPLAPLPDDPLNASPISLAAMRTPGSGIARGVELFARQLWGDAELTLAYTLAFSDRRLKGDVYPPRFQRRHSATMTAIVPIGESAMTSARLTFGTGQPYTPVIGFTRPLHYNPEAGLFQERFSPRVAVGGEHNGARLPGYLRLDVAARKSWDVEWFGADLTMTPYVQIINVLNTPNVLFGYPETFGRTRLEFAPQLPILPTFGLEWRF